MKHEAWCGRLVGVTGVTRVFWDFYRRGNSVLELMGP